MENEGQPSQYPEKSLRLQLSITLFFPDLVQDKQRQPQGRGDRPVGFLIRLYFISPIVSCIVCLLPPPQPTLLPFIASPPAARAHPLIPTSTTPQNSGPPPRATLKNSPAHWYRGIANRRTLPCKSPDQAIPPPITSAPLHVIVTDDTRQNFASLTAARLHHLVSKEARGEEEEELKATRARANTSCTMSYSVAGNGAFQCKTLKNNMKEK